MQDEKVPYGFFRGSDLYLSAWGDYEERKIGEVKEDGPEAAVKYFQSRFEEFRKKVTSLTIKIDSAENKGSFLMKLLHLKEQLAVHDGLGDYSAIHQELLKYEALLTDIIGKNRERNTVIKTALLEEMQEAIGLLNWQEATDKVQDIKSRWLKTGNAKEEQQEELEASFWGMVEDFFKRKKDFYEDKRRLNDSRLEKYEELIEETKVLSTMRGKERFDKVKQLKAAWSEVGNVPARDYKRLLFTFNRNLKGRKEPPAPDFEKLRKELTAVFDRTVPVDKEMLQRYRKSLGSFRPRDPELKKERHEIMELINIIWERDFLEGLASKKNRDFEKKPESEKKEILKKLLREFIRRDNEDLKQYEENSLKFAGHDQKTNQMLERKLGQQRNKIKVKEKLLEILNGEQG